MLRAEEASPFAKGTTALSLSGSYVTPIRFSDDTFYEMNVSAGKYFWNNSALNVELLGAYVDQPDIEDRALLGGIGLVGRWHFLVVEKFSIFFDGGGDVTYSDHEVPPGGTNFNFIGKFGFGATIELRDRFHLIGGCRYFHLSNGQIRGKDDNPSYDGVQIWGGVMWTW